MIFLWRLYQRVQYHKIIKNVKVPFKMAGGDRIDDTPVHRALREALANCLVNTDFFVPRGVVIKQESDMLVLENPGSIRVGKYQMKLGGVPELFAVWQQEGWEEPLIKERQDNIERTIVTLSFKKKVPKKTAEKKCQKSAEKKVTKKHWVNTKQYYLPWNQVCSIKQMNLQIFLVLRRVERKYCSVSWYLPVYWRMTGRRKGRSIENLSERTEIMVEKYEGDLVRNSKHKVQYLPVA